MPSAPDSLDAALASLVHEELGRPLGAFVASLAAVVARLTAGGAEGTEVQAAQRAPRARPVARVRRVVRTARPAVSGLEVAPAFHEVPSAIPTARVWVRRQGSLVPLPAVSPGASGAVGSE